MRSRIQATKLADRLGNHALGTVEMTGTQVRAAEILLRKTVPDLQSIALTGPNGGAVQITRKWYGGDP